MKWTYTARFILYCFRYNFMSYKMRPFPSSLCLFVVDFCLFSLLLIRLNAKEYATLETWNTNKLFTASQLHWPLVSPIFSFSAAESSIQINLHTTFCRHQSTKLKRMKNFICSAGCRTYCWKSCEQQANNNEQKEDIWFDKWRKISQDNK